MTATIDPAKPGAARALERLASEKMAWLTSVDPDGQPQSAPIWFQWTDDGILLYSHRTAKRNRNIRTNPRVVFNLHTDAAGEEVVVMEGTARFDPDGPRASQNPDYLAKYDGFLQEYGWDAAYMEHEYPFIIRIAPTGWRID